MFNWFRPETLLEVIHHPEFLSVLPLGARVGCCLGLGFWDLKMLGDCVIHCCQGWFLRKAVPRHRGGGLLRKLRPQESRLRRSIPGWSALSWRPQSLPGLGVVVVVVGLQDSHLHRYGLECDLGSPTPLLTTVPLGEVKTGTGFTSWRTRGFRQPGGWKGRALLRLMYVFRRS